MSFLDDVRVECSECQGRRYTDEVLELRWKVMAQGTPEDVARCERSHTARYLREVFANRTGRT